MDKVEITMKDKKKLIKGFIFKMAVFAPFKVIHVKTDSHKDNYLIYFHDSLVYGDALESIGLDSFINHVFDKGIVLESNHHGAGKHWILQNYGVTANLSIF